MIATLFFNNIARSFRFGDADTAALRDWAPPSSTPGGCPYRDDGRSDLTRAGRGRRRVPRPDRAAPPRARGALLPDARLLAGRGGRAAGHVARGVAGPRRVRRTSLAPHLALTDRHQPVPQRAPRGRPAARQGVERPRRRTARADPARGGGVPRAVPRLPARRRARRAARARGPLRADRVDLARLRDGASGAAAPPARRPDPARRARLPRERGRRDAGLERRLGEQRAQAGASWIGAPPRGRAAARRRLARRGGDRGEVRRGVRVR